MIRRTYSSRGMSSATIADDDNTSQDSILKLALPATRAKNRDTWRNIANDHRHRNRLLMQLRY